MSDYTMHTTCEDDYTPAKARWLLQDFTMNDLRAACRRLKVNPKGMTKALMIEAIIERDEGIVRP